MKMVNQNFGKEVQKMIDCNITKNYFNEKQRMTKMRKLYAGIYKCKLNCSDCPLSSLNNDATDKMTCREFESLYPEQAISIVQRWSNANPQRTYLTEFLEHYPNAKLNDAGVPDGICPYMLGLTDNHDCKRSCVECWNQHIGDSKEN